MNEKGTISMKKMYLRATAIAMAVLVGASSFSGIPVSAETGTEATEITTTDPNLDTDSDGLQDYLEEYFGTDKTIVDTDGDGLSDYTEIYILKTDPLKTDSDGDGVTDDLEDADGDGICNLEEIKIGTNPWKADTDEDGLSDSEEINVYQTSPILNDSDNDGLLDGDEIILNLNPVKKFTEGLINDCKRFFSQTLKTKYIDEFLRSLENDAIPSISGKLPGLIDRNVSIENSTVVLEDMEEVMIGYPISVISSYEDGQTLKLAFTCKKGTLRQVKDYVICHYDEEKDEVTYLKTSVLLRRISAEITEGGTYFVVDSSKLGENVEIGAVAQTLSVARVMATDTDTDYDGIADSSDPTPKNNAFTGNITNSSFNITYPVSYAIDYRNFFKTVSTFNSNLCKASSVYANLAYGFTIKDGASGKSFNLKTLMSYQGLSDVQYYNLSSSYSDDHITKFYIGHRTVTYNGTTKDIIVVSIQGTDSTIQQWTSNFDIGTTSTFSSYADWTTSANHKGFDMAATRVLKKINSYISTYVTTGNTRAYWVTGHSRGAAIANILGAKLKDNGYTAYTYTFATPNTTTKAASTASGYTNIFNIVNSDDFVPCLPSTAWSFRRYGRTSTASIASSYETEWEDLTGISDYNPDTFGMQDTVKKIGAIFNARNKAYVYTCDCHGDGSSDNITIRNYGTSKTSRENAIAKIPSNALPYCKITRYTGTGIIGWDFEVCQQPAYFMQILAAKMAGTISDYRFVTELNIADRYESAKSAIISSAIGGLEHPHYTETYYVLAKHATASSFS